MAMMRALGLCVILALNLGSVALPQSQHPLLVEDSDGSVSPELFSELEEQARLVDISYCVGTTGIAQPFSCLSRCVDFPTFELIKSWNTGPLLSDSCGYIALDHDPTHPRIVVAFRGTYSIANTIVDLSTNPQEYIPYPGDAGTKKTKTVVVSSCANCTVHSGFLRAWTHTRAEIQSDIDAAVSEHPSYRLQLVGHSLGGAVALLAATELRAHGHKLSITTFGEPKVGNADFADYIDAIFMDNEYRRVTHVEDPVPLLPLTEWGFRPHAGEIYIKKADLPPEIDDLQICTGDHDALCSAGADSSLIFNTSTPTTKATWAVPTRYKLWQLFFAHRDYFWRIGLCAPGGDPWGWNGVYEHSSTGETDETVFS